MRVVNCMKHACTIILAGRKLTIEPSGPVAEVQTVETRIGERYLGEGPHGLQVPIISRTCTEVKGLPDPDPGTIYLVSSMVLAAVPDRTDVFAPDSGATATRNDKGHVVAVHRLIGNA